MLENFCIESSKFINREVVYLVSILILLSAFSFISWIIFKKTKKSKKKIFNLSIFTILSLLIIPVLFFTSIVITEIYMELYDEPTAGKYFPLNAAIKNTCYLDPQKLNCPQTVQDLMNIEPDNFGRLTKDAALTYRYYPETNEYTLIVREKGSTKVAIFDPRLLQIEYQGYKADYANVRVAECPLGNAHKIPDPPPFSGPWDRIN